MSKTPFMYLKDNIDRITFDCEEKYIGEYKRAFKAVLDRMDKYFVKNNLYAVVDYQPIVESMLSSKRIFLFYIDFEVEKFFYSGMYYKLKNGIRKIGMSKESMGKGTVTEGVLCHEFIHHLTLGPNVITYTENGDKYEVRLPDCERDGVKVNVTKKIATSLTVNATLADNNFICEAFTEILKQEIYSQKESCQSYNAQTELIRFINELMGIEIDVKDFLRGNLPSYVNILGIKNFDMFNKYCKRFHAKSIKNSMIYYEADNDYLAAQDIVCKAILKSIEEKPKKYSIKEYIRIVSCILAKAPSVDKMIAMTDDRYEGVIEQVEEALAACYCSERQKQEFKDLLVDTRDKAMEQKKEIYKTLFSKLDFVFRRTEGGLFLSFKGRGDIPSGKLFINDTLDKKILKQGGVEVCGEVDDKGVYHVKVSGKGFETLKIDIIARDNFNDFLIRNISSGEIIEIDFNDLKKRRDCCISENIALLDNFKYLEMKKSALKKINL